MKLKIKIKMTFKAWMLWLLLHFLPTYKNCDNSEKNFATVVYAKKFRGDIYIWKVKYYQRNEAGKFKRLKNKRGKKDNFGLPIAEEPRIKPVTSEQQNENLCESCGNKNKKSCPFLGKTTQSYDCSNYQNIMYDGAESETIKHLMSVCFELAHQVNLLSAEVTKLRDKSFNVLLKLQKLQKKNGVKTRGKKK